jgi:hypothetical protein
MVEWQVCHSPKSRGSPRFAKFATIVQDKGESIYLNFDCAPAAGTEDLMKQPNASMDNVPALHAKIKAAKNVWERCGPINNTVKAMSIPNLVAKPLS